jgi:hypothetical protein
MHPNVPYFIILLCLMPDDFIRHGESAATQWVNPLGCNVPKSRVLCINPLSGSTLHLMSKVVQMALVK